MNNDQEQDRGEFAPAPTVFNDLASLKYKTTVGPIESAMREQRIQDGDLSRSNQSKGNNMTKQEALNIIKLLSALESWAFSTKTMLPDYLHDDLCVTVRKLEAIVLEKQA